MAVAARPKTPLRRDFLKAAIVAPMIAAAGSSVSPLLRFLKPNARPFEILYRPTVNDAPRGEATVAARLSEILRPWDFRYFSFTQRYPQYASEGQRAASVPAVVLRLPRDITLPWAWARSIGRAPQAVQSDIIVFSRICPHLGCIFNYISNWREVTAGYGGYVPPAARRHALMACPCHLSIYDPADAEQPGRVLSGPAPRPPRTFLYELRGEEIVVTDLEPGGIA